MEKALGLIAEVQSRLDELHRIIRHETQVDRIAWGDLWTAVDRIREEREGGDGEVGA